MVLSERRLLKILFLSILCLIIFSITGCSALQISRSEVEDRIQECLIDVSVFPDGWTVASEPQPYDSPDRVLPGRAKGGVMAEFHQSEYNARAFQEVFLYANENKAAKEFVRQQPSYFSSAGRLSEWTDQRIISDGDIANERRFACAYFEGSTNNQPIHYCPMMARYGPFLTMFSTWQSPEYMSFEEMIRIVKAIDEDMGLCMKTWKQ